MSDTKFPLREGYQPLDKGYQPQQLPADPPIQLPDGGYQPAGTGGDDTANPPAPPKEE